MTLMDARSNGRLPIGQAPTPAEGGRASAAIAEARKNITEAKLHDSIVNPGHTDPSGPPASPAKPAPTKDSYEPKQPSLLRGVVKKVLDRL